MSVAKKISEVMEKVHYLKKDGKVNYGSTSYGFLSEEKITAELNKAFREVGLIIYPAEMEVVNSQGNIAQIKATYCIMDIDEPDSFITVQTIGEGQDKGDKKMNKAMTAAFKYAQRQSFMMPTGDDPDHISTAELEDEEVSLKEIRVSELSKVSKQTGVKGKQVKSEVLDILEQRGHKNITEPDEQEWETIVSQLKENLEG